MTFPVERGEIRRSCFFRSICAEAKETKRKSASFSSVRVKNRLKLISKRDFPLKHREKVCFVVFYSRAFLLVSKVNFSSINDRTERKNENDVFFLSASREKFDQIFIKFCQRKFLTSTDSSRFDSNFLFSFFRAAKKRRIFYFRQVLFSSLEFFFRKSLRSFSCCFK